MPANVIHTVKTKHNSTQHITAQYTFMWEVLKNGVKSYLHHTLYLCVLYTLNYLRIMLGFLSGFDTNWKPKMGLEISESHLFAHTTLP